MQLVAVICDTPARKFCACTKGHNGKGGCDRCCDPGVSFRRESWIFNSLIAELRTHAFFLSRLDPDHHDAILTSPLERLDIDLVHCLPLDYMYLVRILFSLINLHIDDVMTKIYVLSWLNGVI